MMPPGMLPPGENPPGATPPEGTPPGENLPPDRLPAEPFGIRSDAARRAGKVVAEAVMKRADKDKDGKISLDELLAAAESLFAECDKDKNGMLDDEELAAGINCSCLGRKDFGRRDEIPNDGPRGRPPRDAEKGEPKP